MTKKPRAIAYWLLPETAAQKLLVSHGRVLGVRTGDKGLNRDGEPMGNYEPGADLVRHRNTAHGFRLT